VWRRGGILEMRMYPTMNETAKTKSKVISSVIFFQTSDFGETQLNIFEISFFPEH